MTRLLTPSQFVSEVAISLLAVLSAVALGGCATVTERYRVGSPDRLAAASLEAAEDLGWTTERLADGKFRLVDKMTSGLLRDNWITVAPGPDGVLSLSGNVAQRDWDAGPTLGVVAPILAQATVQKLGVAPGGPPVERRSVGLTVGLDLLFPAVGAAYALRGSPYLKTSWSTGWGMWVAAHSLLDVAFALNLGIGVDYLQRGRRDFAVGYLVGSILGLVMNRVIALLFQVPVVGMGNAAADSGFWLDSSRAPERLPGES